MKKISLTAIFFILFLVTSLKDVHALPPPVCNAPAHTSLTDWGQQCDVASGSQSMSYDLIGVTTAGSEGSGLGFCQRYQDDTNYGKACPANHIDYVWKGPNGEHCKLYVDFCGYPEEASGNCSLQPSTGALIINWDARRCALCQNFSLNTNDPFGAGVKVSRFSALNNRLQMTAFYNPAFGGDPNDTRIEPARNRIDYMFILEQYVGGVWQEVTGGRTYLYGNNANYGNWVSCQYSNPAHQETYRNGRPVTNHNITCASTAAFPGIAFPFKGWQSGATYRVRTFIKPSFLLGSNDWNSTDICMVSFSINISPTPTPTPPPLACQYITYSPLLNVKIGTTVTLSCTAKNQVPNHFNFRYQVNNGNWVQLPGVPANGSYTRTASYVAQNYGVYNNQCQVCASADDSRCTTWGRTDPLGLATVIPTNTPIPIPQPTAACSNCGASSSPLVCTAKTVCPAGSSCYAQQVPCAVNGAPNYNCFRAACGVGM